MEKGRYYEKDSEQEKGLVADEGLISKFLKAGLVAAGVGILGKKATGTGNVSKFFKSDVGKAVTIIGGTALLSEDEDVGSNLIAATSLIYAGKKFSNIKARAMDDIEFMAKLSDKFKKADEYKKEFSLFSMGMTEKITDSLMTNLSKNMKEINREGNVSSQLFSQAKAIGKTAFDVMVEPLEAIRKEGFINGAISNFKAIKDTNTYKEYKTVNSVDGLGLVDVIQSTERAMSKIDSGISFYNEEAGISKVVLESVSKRLGAPGLFNDIDENSASEKIKKFKKIKQIEDSTTFSDMLGIFSNYNKSTNTIDANYTKILSGDNNNLEMMQKLASDFEKEAYSKFKGYKGLEKEAKENLFVNYLNENGFEDLVKENYKNKKYINIGEISERIDGKHVFSQQDYDIAKSGYEKYVADGSMSKTDFDFAINVIENKLNNRIDDELYSAISNDRLKGFSKKVVQKYEDDLIIGLKNSDLIKNFSLTNVLEKTSAGFKDKTALDSTISAWSMVGIIEKNVMGMYSTPLAKNLNVWNPLKLIESENRIKGIIANDYMKFSSSADGFLVDGKKIQHKMTMVDKVVNGKKIKNKNGEQLKEYTNNFYSDNSRANRRSYLKQHIDTLDENYLVLKENEKFNYGYRNIYDTFRKEGIKSATEKFSKSHMNPTGFRYEKGEGFRLINFKEGYFSETPVMRGLNNKNLANSSVLNTLEEAGKESRAANFIFGQSGDINVRHLNIDNRNVEARAKLGIKMILEENFEKGSIMKAIMQSEGKDANSFVYKHSSKMASDRMGTLLNFTEDNYFSKQLTSADKTTLKNIKALSDKGTITSEHIVKMSQNKNLKFVDGTGFSKDWMSNKEFVEEFENLLNIKNGILPDSVSQSPRFESFINNMAEWLYDGRNSVVMHNNKMTVGVLTENTERLFNFGKTNERIASKAAEFGFSFDPTVLQDAPGEKRLTSLMSVNNFVIDVFDSQKRAKIAINEHLFFDKIGHNNILSRNIAISDYSELDDFHSSLRTNYEAALGFEYNKVLSTNELEAVDKLRGLREISKKYKDQEVSPVFRRLFNYAEQDYDRDYAVGGLDKFNNAVRGERIMDDDFKSYRFFDKVIKNNETAFESENGFTIGAEKNLFKTIEEVRNKKYKVRGEEINSSVILQDSIKRHYEISSILGSIREGVHKLINNNGKSFTSSSNGKVISGSKMFGKDYSTFDVFMKGNISRMQDTIQFLGVERIPGKNLGDHWTSHYGNFMKYRYVPLALGVTTYIAADSLSDALVPDEVPIFGNGITGVATRAVAGARIGVQYGLKYTGILGAMQAVENAVPGLIDNGLSHILNPLMDPSEMIDVYFGGKAVRTNKNRNWFTAGRQSGEGEEFDQYRPHLLYTMGNRTAGIYDNKFEKFLRQDSLLTKYPWYVLDPYKEERDAYEKFGALYPMTEQLFKDVPIFGHLMNATIGEAIKPTQYVGEKEWLVAPGVMRNINYDPTDSSSAEFIEFSEPNKFVRSFFEAAEDIKTWSGLSGYSITKMTEYAFGATNPYANKVTLDSIDNDTSYYSRYDDLGLGGMFGTTEGVRRLLDDGDALGMIEMNPLKQKIPEWMPSYFQNGRNPYMKWNAGEYILPGSAFEKTSNSTGNEELDKFRILSMTAPASKEYRMARSNMARQSENFSTEEKNSYYESLGYADRYGKREYMNKHDYTTDVKSVELKVDEKISPYEFMSDGKRYKIDSVESDFNKLSNKIGQKRATLLMGKLDDSIKVGGTVNVSIANDSAYSVGVDQLGDFIKVDSELVNRNIKGESVYNRKGGSLKSILFPVNTIMNRVKNSPMPSHIEKLFGKKSAYNEWFDETVQAPYFRDWDDPYSSFVEPFYNYSSNSLVSSFAFNKYSNETFLTGGADFNALGLISMLGTAKLPLNKLTGQSSISSQYQDETDVQFELEKIKHLAGDKSYFNMSGKESIKQFSKMVNEQDAEFLEDLANTSNKAEREKILSNGNEMISNVLKTIWNRHQELIDGANNDNMYNIEKSQMNNYIDIGAYDGNSDYARAILKSKLGIKHSKLDNKRIGINKSYRGGMTKSEAEFVKNKMRQTYADRNAKVTSTIYPKGQININRRND